MRNLKVHETKDEVFRVLTSVAREIAENPDTIRYAGIHVDTDAYFLDIKVYITIKRGDHGNGDVERLL